MTFPDLRVGSGFDVHPLVEGRPLVIGGVTIPYPRGLVGDSDGDVLYHATADAILGGSGNGDLGVHFPPGDTRWVGLDSGVLVTTARTLAEQSGFRLVNVDATVVAQQPKLRPFFEEMRMNLARLLDLDLDRVNVKAKSTDGLGFLGRREGIAALVTALVARPPAPGSI
ncbi:MAG: 2-C-methyl-D-erythritol 2,4-cyclodiphosphate synthase [Candidatus Riflebacteria bacterium]|nr:2-C-methyl-D-erythritol 2,4-cyclodiphosphate synthase [Candidatus Riflebacteria bacterium]